MSDVIKAILTTRIIAVIRLEHYKDIPLGSLHQQVEDDALRYIERFTSVQRDTSAL
jgi:hypothetical protein